MKMLGECVGGLGDFTVFTLVPVYTQWNLLMSVIL